MKKKKLNPACAGCIFKQALRQVYEGGGGGGGLSETSFRIKCFKMKTLHLVRIHFRTRELQLLCFYLFLNNLLSFESPVSSKRILAASRG